MVDLNQAPINPDSLNNQAIDGPIENALSENAAQNGFPSVSQNGWAGFSAVMFLVGQCQTCAAGPEEPCLILNKRSEKVRQPGDLCFPGGGISLKKDRPLSVLLRLPKSPLRKLGKKAAGNCVSNLPGRLHRSFSCRRAQGSMGRNALKPFEGQISGDAA